jgi:hypothetical protein
MVWKMPERIKLKYVKKSIVWDEVHRLPAYFEAWVNCPVCDSCNVPFSDGGSGYLDDLQGVLTQVKKKVKDIRHIRTRSLTLGNAMLYCPKCVLGKGLSHRVVVRVV